MDEELLNEVPKPVTDYNVPVTEPTPVVDNNVISNPEPVITDKTPSINRENPDDLSIDENYNFDYLLKNGKQLKISVAKPSLQISTELSDKEVKFVNGDDGEQIMMANTLGVYNIIMDKLIKVILQDGAPIHDINFKNLSKIGMSKAELDDVMNVINTFYLS